MSKEIKIGEWVTDTQTQETFVVLKIDNYPIQGTLESEKCYFDIYYQGHITYHCIRANQIDIEKECQNLLDADFR